MPRKNLEAGVSPEKNQEAEVSVLSPDEIQTVIAKAQLRLLNYDFRSQVVDFQKKEAENPANQGDQEALKKIVAEAAGESLLQKESAEKILKNKQSLAEQADSLIDVNPTFAQLSYVTLAKAEQAAGEDYSDSLRLAQEIKATLKGEKPQRLADFNADAVLIGILQRQAGNRELPDLKSLADYAALDQKILRACALALPSEQREKFLDYLPAETKDTAAKVMDRELSKVLGQDKISESESEEREAVKGRLGETLKAAFEGKEDIGHGLLLEMIDSLDNLGGEDSKRLMLEIGLASLKKEKDPIKALTKNAQLSRLVKKLFEIDQKMGGNLAMKFLARQEVPDSLFKFMIDKSVREKYLSANTSEYLKDDVNLPWLRRLIAQYPNQFNTAIDTIIQLPDYRPAENQEVIFGAIEDLGSLTPIIFSRYAAADKSERKELAGKIKSLKPRFFRNEPIADILPKSDRDILVEMVYLAYKPVGMSFDDVKKLVKELKDQTDDLANYNFPEDGYDFTMTGDKKHELKPGEKINLNQFNEWRDAFDTKTFKSLADQLAALKKKISGESSAGKSEPSDNEKIGDLLESVVKAKTEFSIKEIGWLLKPLAENGLVKDFLENYQSVNEKNAFSFLAELQEVVGVFFKDNFKPKLVEFLYLPENQKLAEKLSKILSNPKRQQTLEKLMSGKLDAKWTMIDMPEELADVLSQYISEKAISPWRQEIKRNAKKFQVQGGGAAVASKSGLKAHISKNIGSFFAKASAGICTAQDIGLFNRDDHFHINIVENDESVKGNIQAYIIEDGDGQSLVLRGFNPNSDFLKNISVEAFCEKVLDIGQQFAKDNGFQHVYIAEQDGGWHALTNRTEVFEYLKRYLKERAAKHHDLQVSTNHNIDTIYQVG